MSLLTMIQDATDLLTLHRPSAIINSTDHEVRQLNVIAVQEAMDLNKLWWKKMMREHTFTTTATAAQTTGFPSDFDRFVPNSFYDRTTRRPIVGPVTPQVWQMLQANPQAGRIVLGYRSRDNTFLLTPTPAADDTIACEYISTKWARDVSLATARVRWTVDTDTTYFDEWLITLGILWRWRKSKGLPYGEDFDTYKDYRNKLLAHDGGATTISVVSSAGDGFAPTIPEGSWNA